MRLLPHLFHRRPRPTPTERLLAALAPLTASYVPAAYATLTVEGTPSGVRTYGCSDGQSAALLAMALRGALEGEEQAAGWHRAAMRAQGLGWVVVEGERG